MKPRLISLLTTTAILGCPSGRPSDQPGLERQLRWAGINGLDGTKPYAVLLRSPTAQAGDTFRSPRPPRREHERGRPAGQAMPKEGQGPGPVKAHPGGAERRTQTDCSADTATM
jgi:hypothetical protein